MTASSTPAGSSKTGLPDDYRRHRVGSVRLIAHRSAEAWAEEAVRSRGSLHAWAAEAPDRKIFAGRGRVYSVPAPASGPDGRARWAVRHYRRGGAVASGLGDRYLRLGRPRPVRELLASATARDRGIRTPAVLAGAVHPAGIYYRCDLVTEVVPGSVSLAAIIEGPDASTEDVVPDEGAVAHTAERGVAPVAGSGIVHIALTSAGRLVDELAESGVHHVDLNAWNVLFEEGDLERPWIVDLDRARIHGGAAPASGRKMRARLARSVVKVAPAGGEWSEERDVVSALRDAG